MTLLLRDYHATIDIVACLLVRPPCTQAWLLRLKE